MAIPRRPKFPSREISFVECTVVREEMSREVVYPFFVYVILHLISCVLLSKLTYFLLSHSLATHIDRLGAMPSPSPLLDV